MKLQRPRGETMQAFLLKTTLVFGSFAFITLAQAQGTTDGSFVPGADGSPGNGSSEQVSGVQLGYPSYGGSGCPGGSVSAALSPGGTSLSILFDQYILEAGRDQRRAQKSCRLILPFQVPQGYQAAVTRIDYRGYNYLPPRAKSHLKANYYLADQGGRRLKGQNRRNIVFQGPVDDVYFVSSKIRNNQIWSGCGQNFQLHIENQMDARTNSEGDDLMSTIDSSDVIARGEVKYHLNWKRCDDRIDRPGRPDRGDRPGRGRGRG